MGLSLTFPLAQKAAAAVLAAVLLIGCGNPEPSPGPTETATEGTASPVESTEPPTPPISGSTTPDPPTPDPSTTEPFTPGKLPLLQPLPRATFRTSWWVNGMATALTPHASPRLYSPPTPMWSCITTTVKCSAVEAVADGSSLTLHVPGGPISYEQWSIDEFDAGYGYTFENLMLDGVSYVRQISGG